MVTVPGSERSIESIRCFLQELFPSEYWPLVWLAGGSVRDALLGREIGDIDLVAAVPPGGLEALGFNHVAAVSTSPIWFRHFRQYGNVEITAVAGVESLPYDLSRRDFTLNAMLMTLDGEVIDPLDGRHELQSLTLQPCSDKTFLNDPIRIFRAFRFEAEGFRLSSGAEALLRCREWDDELAQLPIERFSREMLKSLALADPGRFFLRMAVTGIGRGILPELFRMPRIPAGPLQFHPEGDLLTHSLQVLERVSSVTGSTLARFCAFFHDIGKLSTDPSLYPRHHGHDEAGFRSAEELCRRLALPSGYGRALAWTSRLHGNVNKLGELRPATRLRMAAQAVRGGLAELLPLISAADKPGHDIAAQWEELLAVVAMNIVDLGINVEQLGLLPPEKRPEFILQKRIEFLKNAARATISC